MAADKGKKIKVVCHGCGARYQVSSDKVVGRRFRATCKRCGGIIVARCTNAFTVQPEDKARKKKKKKQLKAPSGDPSWYVVISGKPHGPLTPDDLRQSFDARKISERSYIWKAGDGQWRRLEDVEEFADLLEETTNFYRVKDGALEDDEETISGGHDPATEEHGHPAFRKAVTAYPDIEDDIVEQDVTEETTVHFQKQAAAELEEASRHQGFAAEPAEPDPVGGGIFDEGQGDDPDFGGDDAAFDDGGGAYDDDQLDAPEHLPEPGWGQPATEWGPADELWPTGPIISARKAFLPMPTGRPRLLKLFVDALKPKREPPPVPASAPLEVDDVSGVEMLDPSSSAVELLPLEPAPAPVQDLDPLPVLTAPPPAAPTPVVAEPALAPAMAPATTMMVSSTAFWTKGKIAAAAAICGGVGVAAAVILGVVLARSQPVDPPPNKVAAVEASDEAAANDDDDDDDETPKKKVASGSVKKASPPAPAKEAAPPPPTAEPKKVAAPGEEPKKEAAVPVPVPPAPPEVEAKKAAPAPAPPPAAAAAPKQPKVVKRRVVRRVAPRFKRRARSRPARRSSSGDVDALLMGSSSRRKRKKRASTSGDGVDGILAAGSRRKRKKRASTSGDGVDGILAAGTRRSSGVPRKPTKTQIRNTMRGALPRVRKCYDRYRQSGIIKVRVRVSPSGRPDAKVVGTFRGTDTAECLLTGVSKLRFPKFSGPPFSFTYPYRLR